MSALTLEHPCPCKFVTAQFSSRTVYGLWRVFWAVYHVTWVLLSWVLEPWSACSSAERVKWFVYLTNWTYLLLTLETVVEAVNFFVVHVLRDDIVKGKDGVRMPWYLRLQWLMYNITTTGSLMVTGWYWTFLYKSEKELGAVRFALHALNSVYVVVNLAVTATPTRVLHAVYAVLFGVVYTLFSVAYQLAGGTNVDGEPYIYRVTDWRRPWKSLLLSSLSNFLAIPLVHLAVFILRLALGRLWTRRCCRPSDTDPRIVGEKETCPLGGVNSRKDVAAAVGGAEAMEAQTVGGFSEIRPIGGGVKDGGRRGGRFVRGCAAGRGSSDSSQGTPLVLDWDDAIGP